MFTASADWKARFPEACFGILAMEGIDNSAAHTGIEEKKKELEEALRKHHNGKSRKEIEQEHPYESYRRYYKSFGQRYHVLFQVETVALKGEPIISPSPLVAIMFMAELKNGLLTAVHDLDRTEPSFLLDVSKGGEGYIAMGGKQRELPPGDMFFSDRRGILSSIIYGPDEISAVTPNTSRALFTVYGTPSISSVEVLAHLEEIEELVRLLSPEATRSELLILE